MAQRKLQGEIDRTLKKVSEGVELFESIFEKIQTTQIQTQKEKFEQDLKTQIKKLQRLRDQIKQWLASNDIKDKGPLLENRKLIETQMERFKACEKEMKTKAFSKEGLSAAAKLDPKEKEKVELQHWITGMVDELSRQVEASEAEVEQLQGARKKKDSDKAARLDELEHLNERRNWHVNRLELILRLLENGNLSTEQVTDIKDDIAYFVESNTEEDFEEDEGIYDELNLSEEEELFGQPGDDHQSSHESVSVAEEPAPRTPAKDAKPQQQQQPAPHEAEKSPSAAKAKQQPQRKSTLDSTTPKPSIVTAATPATATRSASMSSSTATPAASKPAPAPLPPIRYAAAAAGAAATAATASATPASSAPAATPSAASSVTSPPPSGVQATSPPPSITAPSQPGSIDVLARKASVPSVTSPESIGTSSEALRATQPSPRAASGAGQGLSQASPVASSASVNGFTSAASNGAFSQVSATSPTPAPQQTAGIQRGDDMLVTSPKSGAADSNVAPGSNAPSASAATGASTTTSNGMALPSSLMDLGASFESAKQKSLLRRDGLGDMSSIGKALDASYTNAPQPVDTEKPKYYVPKNPYQTPSYYPHEPSAQFANPTLFSKFDVDTLFYIFYYCQGTYLQYLAAQELKKQSWRFHKQYLTWFQRASEPTQITDEYEQGVYLYFDWEGSWCQRRKSDFKFYYSFLSSD